MADEPRDNRTTDGTFIISNGRHECPRCGKQVSNYGHDMAFINAEAGTRAVFCAPAVVDAVVAWLKECGLEATEGRLEEGP